MNHIQRTVAGAARVPHQVRKIAMEIETMPDGRLRVTLPHARGWAAVASTQHELARAVGQAFREAQVAAYARWRGTRYDLSTLTDHVPGDPLAPPREPRARRAARGTRGDVYLATDWTELADGRWRSPSGRVFRGDAVQVQQVKRKLAVAPPRAA